MRMQTVLQAVFPPECLGCGVRVDADFGLCGVCWSDTPFITGAHCDLCGTALPGQTPDGEVLICDECHRVERPWNKGRAVMRYAGKGRGLVMGLKHADRAEVARAAGPWLMRAAGDLLKDKPLLVPVPLHPIRLALRRYNQSAMLALALGHTSGAQVSVQALRRVRATPSQEGRGRDGRFENLAGAIAPHPRHGKDLSGRSVIVIDDVMTSGATFSAATEACRAGGATQVCVLALARAGGDA